MRMITVNQSESGQPVELCVRDVGQGPVIVLLHGWPLSHQMWEYQLSELPRRGFRVVTYDRRGFGASSKPHTGYDYDTFADDLRGVMQALDLQDVTLAGFSMGGGEVARYMSRHHGERVARVAFIASVVPGMLHSDQNPDGIDLGVVHELQEKCDADRPDFLANFSRQFFGVNVLRHPVSTATLDWVQGMALQASHEATLACIQAFSQTVFERDLASIQVPALIVHGDADAIVPIAATAERVAEALPNSLYKVYDGAPHGLFLTHRHELNEDLATFMAAGQLTRPEALGTTLR